MLPNQTTNVFVSITEIEGDRNTECTLNLYVELCFEYLSNGIFKVCMNSTKKCKIIVILLRNDKIPF